MRFVFSQRLGFSLVEMMVAVTILSFLLLIMLSITNEIGASWKTTTAQIESYQGARSAFERMTQRIGQATLNGYYDYFDASGNGASSTSYNHIPARIGRQSDLHFISGKALLPKQVTHAVFFQAALGQAGKDYSSLRSLLNACGYYVVFGDDSSNSSLSGKPSFLSAFSSPRYRYRLMEFSQASEDLKIYSSSGTQWFSDPLSGTPPAARVLTENIIALVLLPKQSDTTEASISSSQRIGANYEYNSRTTWGNTSTTQPAQMNQLCPVLRVVMVAIDEASAQRLQGNSQTEPDLGFSYAGLFQSADQLQADLATVESALSKKRINYRIFQSDIPLRGGQWSAGAL